MNIGTTTCLMLAGLFLLIALIFALLKEKGAMLISGFNTLPKAERLKYDQVKMSKDMRNSFIIWATILAVGGLLSFFIHNYFAIISLIVWLFLFLKDVHFDPEKAFGKYRL
ncbi:MAG: DUF3784 domain-containing protein [Eubacteriaceae bacterium]|nr:hypothetical protein [Eubacteriaceae bacterium]MDK2937482.1 hypothetical protein [Eubacteriaceae bacterium]